MLIGRLFKRPEVESEAYIISYPKTGRTWLRALLGRCLTTKMGFPEKMTLETAYLTSAAGLLRTSFIHDGSALKQNSSYRDFDSDKSFYSDKKVVLLSRDVKDTLVSAYFQATKRIRVFSGPISEFIRSDLYGVRKILSFYSIWHENRHVPEDLLFITYEDLHRSPLSVLEDVMSFLGAADLSVYNLQEAVEYCSFENLRNAERENRFESNLLRPKEAGDSESFKVRKGQVGNYREYLSTEDVEFVDEMIRRFGCEYVDYQ